MAFSGYPQGLVMELKRLRKSCGSYAADATDGAGRGRRSGRPTTAASPIAPTMPSVRPKMIAPARAHRGDRGRGGGGPWGEDAASRSAGRGRGRLAGRHAPANSTKRTNREQFSLLPRRPARAAPNVIPAQERVNEWSAGRAIMLDVSARPPARRG